MHDRQRLVNIADAAIQAPLGTHWRKRSGSEWQGHVVGYYTTDLTQFGVAIESEVHVGSVQIYPLKALEKIE